MVAEAVERARTGAGREEGGMLRALPFVCVCVRERERESECGVCVCVCMCV